MEPEKKSNGAFVGLIIIIIILVLGGIYIWMTAQNEAQNQNQSENITEQDSILLDELGNDLDTADTDVGVDVNAVN